MMQRGWRVVRRWVIAGCALLAAGPLWAQPSTWYSERPGPYLLLAGGGSQYDFDCFGYYYYDCASGRASTGKLAFGYRFGRFGVEGSWTDFGRARINDGTVVPRQTIAMQALGVNAVWSLAFSPATEGLLRAGLADVRHSRSDDIGSQHVFTASVGLALLLHLGPQVALEVGWDATSGEGRQRGSAVASALTAGLRWSF